MLPPHDIEPVGILLMQGLIKLEHGLFIVITFLKGHQPMRFHKRILNLIQLYRFTPCHPTIINIRQLFPFPLTLLLAINIDHLKQLVIAFLDGSFLF
jgi:hypothetical protein